MQIPPALKPNDTIAIISTARMVDKAFIQTAIQTIEAHGYKAITGKHLFASDHQYSGTDLQRAADLQTAINNPEVKAIWCARGGYGTVRLLEHVDLAPLLDHPKWIMGYSDVTVLHCALQNLGIASLHSTMPVNLDGNTPQAIETFWSHLEGKPVNIDAPKHALNRAGKVTAPLIGGNLSILYSLSGTNNDINTAGKILVIEDLDEYLYHIDRMLMNLKLGNKLSRLAGLVVGGMSDMNDNAIPFGKTALEIIHEHVSAYNFPVCFDFPTGHIADNRAWINGHQATLMVADAGSTLKQLPAD